MSNQSLRSKPFPRPQTPHEEWENELAGYPAQSSWWLVVAGLCLTALAFWLLS